MCKHQNLHPQHYIQVDLEVPVMSMHFIVMDLMGKYKVSPQAHQYGLTVTNTLTNYTWCMLLFSKVADKVMHTYFVHMYSKFGGLHKILSDSGTEFKNNLFAQVSSTMRMNQVFSSPCYSLGNGCIENIYNFLKYADRSISPLTLHGMKWFI